MKLPGEAGGNWSERQTKARTYGHGLQLHSAAVGRRLGHLLYFRGEFLIHSPSLIPATRPRPRARGSFIRPANYESSRRMSNRLNCEAPPQPKARTARESVSSCADCATATQPRAPVPNPIPVPVLVPVLVPIPVPIPVPDHISPRREGLNSLPELLPFSYTTRDLLVICPCMYTASLFYSFLVINTRFINQTCGRRS